MKNMKYTSSQYEASKIYNIFIISSRNIVSQDLCDQ